MKVLLVNGSPNKKGCTDALDVDIVRKPENAGMMTG